MKAPKRIPAVFFRTERGNEPVREFLRELGDEDRDRIGKKIKLVEYAWPIGMPTTRPLGDGLHEVRTNLPRNRINRVFFYVSEDEKMVLLHTIIKKTETTPQADLDLARERMKQHQEAARSARSKH